MKPVPIMPTDADHRAARNLLRAADHGTLATLRGDGTPFASLAAIATDGRGEPLLLLSELAEHTRNIQIDPRVSLMVEEVRHRPNPQTKARVTVVGRLEQTSVDRDGRRYLTRHPSASLYAGFGDFSFWRLTMSSAHFVAGFGRAVELGRDMLIDAATAKALVEGEGALLERLATDEDLDPARIANKVAGQRGKKWRFAGIDADGVDLVLKARTVRVPFDRPASGPEDVADRMADLAARARH